MPAPKQTRLLMSSPTPSQVLSDTGCIQVSAWKQRVLTAEFCGAVVQRAPMRRLCEGLGREACFLRHVPSPAGQVNHELSQPATLKVTSVKVVTIFWS